MIGTFGGQEIFLILILALIFFGPRKLPEIGKSIGKMLVEFRRASNDFKRTVEQEVETEKTQVTPPATGLPAPITAATGVAQETPTGSVAAADAADPSTGLSAGTSSEDAAPALSKAETTPGSAATAGEPSP